jgi:hypothetical protein
MAVQPQISTKNPTSFSSVVCSYFHGELEMLGHVTSDVIKSHLTDEFD